MRNAVAVSLLFLANHFLHAQYSEDTIYSQVEQMPFFAGCKDLSGDLAAKRRCSDQKIVRFISRNLNYPDIAKEKGIEGTVVVSFIIDENGALTDPSILTDIGEGCGNAALELISKMPDWEPAKEQGKAVKVRLNLPIQFSLKQSVPDNATSYTLTWGSLRGGKVTTGELNNTLGNQILVRDALGNNRFIDELAFTFEKNKRLINAKSRGSITSELIKVVEKTKKGGIFTITASVQNNGDFIYVSRSFEVSN